MSPALVTAGELRSRATIMRPIGTTSATGGVIEGTPEVFAERIPAAITSALGSEVLRAGGLVAGVTHIVKIRYLFGVQSYMTVTFEDRTFQILSIVDTDERHIEHQLLCAEVQ
jgi:SPP1 family predicted phage head-tail adaptor